MLLTYPIFIGGQIKFKSNKWGEGEGSSIECAIIQLDINNQYIPEP